MLAGLLMLVPGCKKAEFSGLNLKIEIQPSTITDELYVKMNYEYAVSDKFAGLTDDQVVFVHFWRVKSKEMLLGDDHIPEKKWSTWKPGDTVKYSRVIFIPKFLDEFDIDFEGYEEIKLTVGVYNPKTPDNKIILWQKVIEIHAASLNAPEVVYDEGWWQVETDLNIKEPLEKTWRWTTKKAVCMIENPRKECLLIIDGRVDKTQFVDQKVIFKINEKVLDEFIPEIDGFSKRYTVSPAMMGGRDEFTLSIETDKTFTPVTISPETKDNRELGIRIFRIYFRENLK